MGALILGLLLIFAQVGLTADVDFGTWFTGETLRIDLFRTGDFNGDEYSLDEVVIEGPWAGTHTKLIDTLNRGFFLYSVYDHESGELLYSRGFSSVFGEWLTTAEAKERKRSIGETAIIPRPRKPFDLTVSKRDEKNNFFEVYRVTIDPNDHNISHYSPNPDYKVIDLHVPAEAHKVFDIVILPEGYTAAEADKLRADAERMANALLETKPYDEMKDYIAVRAVEAFSHESGIDQPREGIWKDTLLDARFNAFDSARYVLTENNKAIADVAANVPYDAVLIMLNTERYGGGGIYNAYACFAVDNEWANYLMTHEGGHSMSGLGDEYYNSAVAYTDFYKVDVEPWEPNITALLDPKNLKWKALVTPGTPIPTPATDEYKQGVVGAFEGAGYMAKGLYRPCFDCKMLSRANIDYCPVCMAAVRQMIMFYTEQ